MEFRVNGTANKAVVTLESLTPEERFIAGQDLMTYDIVRMLQYTLITSYGGDLVLIMAKMATKLDWCWRKLVLMHEFTYMGDGRDN